MHTAWCCPVNYCFPVYPTSPQIRMAAVGGGGDASAGAAAGESAGGSSSHKLLDSWKVWEGHGQDKKFEKHWNDSRITIYEFETVEDFWRRWAL